MHITKNQMGDTIVEVMIAMAIISGVLGATFAVANRSQRATQANHERYQAQLYANEQAEWIKAMSSTDILARQTFITTVSAATHTNFCMVNSSTIKAIADITAIPAECQKEGLYDIVITRATMTKNIDGTGAAENNTYYIKVQWDSLVKTDGKDKVEIVYGI